MKRIFKISCSAISKIMGEIGLTEIQKKRFDELQLRNTDPLAKPLTDNMKKEFAELKDKLINPQLPETCTTYLKEWYANENRSLHNKYIDKGVMCEYECIEFMANVLDFGVAEKNIEQKETDFITGSCDVNLPDCIVDVKSSWDKQTLQANVMAMDEGYKWQGVGYCILFKKNKFILFYGLMDTDESINFGEEVIYSELPDNERWIAYEVNFTNEELREIEHQINQRVLMCRDWLDKYDQLVKSKMGKLNLITL